MRTAAEDMTRDTDHARREARLIAELLALYRREGGSHATQAKLQELRRLRNAREPVH